MKALFVVVTVSLGLFFAVAVRADDKAGARRHFKSGKVLMKVDDFKSATAEFKASVALYPTKNALFNLAQCEKAMHRYGDALLTLEKLTSEFGNKLSDEMRKEVKKHRTEIRNLIATIEIRVDKPGAAVLVDGREVGVSPLPAPVTVGPGEHAIEVSLDGHETLERALSLVSRENKIEDFSLKLLVAEPPEPEAAPVEAPEKKEEQQQPEVEPEPAAPVEPAGELESDKGGLPAMFWVGLVGTVAAGAVSGIFYGLGSASASDYRDYLSQYENLSQSSEKVITAYKERELYNKLEAARDDTGKYDNLFMGAIIATGAFALTTIISLAVGLSDRESDDAQISATPGGVAVRF